MSSNIDYLNSKAESRLIPQKSEEVYKKEYGKFIINIANNTNCTFNIHLGT